MNIQEARDALNTIDYYVNYDYGYEQEQYHEAKKKLIVFINEMEQLLKHNSIKQTPALFKEKK